MSLIHELTLTRPHGQSDWTDSKTPKISLEASRVTSSSSCICGTFRILPRSKSTNLSITNSVEQCAANVESQIHDAIDSQTLRHMIIDLINVKIKPDSKYKTTMTQNEIQCRCTNMPMCFMRFTKQGQKPRGNKSRIALIYWLFPVCLTDFFRPPAYLTSVCMLGPLKPSRFSHFLPAALANIWPYFSLAHITNHCQIAVNIISVVTAAYELCAYGSKNALCVT